MCIYFNINNMSPSYPHSCLVYVAFTARLHRRLAHQIRRKAHRRAKLSRGAVIQEVPC